MARSLCRTSQTRTEYSFARIQTAPGVIYNNWPFWTPKNTIIVNNLDSNIQLLYKQPKLFHFMGGKRAKPTQVDKWRKDVKYVENIKDDKDNSLYSNEDIAEKMGIDPTHLSSCKSGKKNPGLAPIEKFYEHFGHLIPPDELPPLNPASKVRDPDDDDPNTQNGEKMDIEYLQKELTKATDTLQTHINNTDKTLQLIQTMADTNKEIAQSNTQLSKGIEILIEKLK